MKDKWTFAAGVVMLTFAAIILIDIDSTFAFVALFAVAGAVLIGKAK